jgi:hypothetical protein
MPEGAISWSRARFGFTNPVLISDENEIVAGHGRARPVWRLAQQTLIAAEKTGRCARLIEFDPIYCDRIVRRYEALTGEPGILAGSSSSFEIITEQRTAGSHSKAGADCGER